MGRRCIATVKVRLESLFKRRTAQTNGAMRVTIRVSKTLTSEGLWASHSRPIKLRLWGNDRSEWKGSTTDS